jgi:hypothetical protein
MIMTVRSFWFAVLCAVVLYTSPHVQAEAHCPRGIEPISYRSLGLSQIGVQVTINGRGPFEFMLDTGAQITVVSPAIAGDLELHPQGTVGIVSVVRYAQADLVNIESLGLGPYRVTNLQVAIQSLDRLRSVNPEIQGILGIDFLRRFDLLIDNAHKALCLDDGRRMQFAILGERVMVVHREKAPDNSLYVPPILIPVHLSADGHQDTVLRIDSGSSAPILFSDRTEILPWLQKAHASRGSTSGTSSRLLLATIPEQSVRIGDRIERRISFLTPIGDGTPHAKAVEDGLLPTALFSEILISFRDGFVVFNPHDACPRPEPN